MKDLVFVLTIVPYRDSDLIVNFLSRSEGKMSAVIYGGRNLKRSSRFPFQSGDLIELEYQKVENREFITVKNAIGSTILSYEQFSYHRFIIHTYLIELIYRIAKPGLQARPLFDILSANLALHWQEEQPFAFITWAVWQLIEAGGYRIDYTGCEKCGQSSMKLKGTSEPSFRKQSYRLSAYSGSICCGNCEQSGEEMQTISPAMIKMMWLFADQDGYTEKLANLPEDQLIPLLKVLNSYLLSSFDINPRSLDSFLQLVR